MNQDEQLAGLQKRIEALQGDQKPTLTGGGELHLVFSLGSVVVSTLLLGLYGGDWLARKTGHPQAQTLVLVLSMGFAGLAAYKLLRPFLR